MTGTSISLERLCEQLLYNHECVVIPGMGGFIVRDSPCNFNAGMDKIKPFARHIFFNPHLNQNDGLLAGELMKQEGIPYSAAMERCKYAAEQLKADIAAAGSLKFGILGTFFKGQENIWFAPAPDLNFSRSSYGLEAIDIQVLEREQASETAAAPVLKTSMADKSPIESIEPEFRKGNGIRPWLVAASVALVVHFVYLVFEKPDSNSHVASVVPAISMPDSQIPDAISDTAVYAAAAETQVAENPISDAGTEPLAAETKPAAETTPAIQAPEIPAASETTVTAAESPTPETPVVEELRVARYKLEANARWHVKDLLKQGKQAYMAYKDGWYEVLSSGSSPQ